MAHRLLTDVTAVGVSTTRKVRVSKHVVDTMFNSTDASDAITAVTVKLQGSETGEDKDTGIITQPGLVVGSTPEKVANIAFAYQIDNVSYTKAAVAAGTTLATGLDGLSATITDYTMTANKYGGFKVYINASGTILCAFPALTQAYASAALGTTAVDALPSEYIVGGKYIEIGKVLIQADGTTWTATTDDLTDTSDVDFALFVSLGSSFFDLATHVFSADEILNSRASFTVIDQPTEWVRVYLSTLTGTGEVTNYYTPVKSNDSV